MGHLLRIYLYKNAALTGWRQSSTTGQPSCVRSDLFHYPNFGELRRGTGPCGERWYKAARSKLIWGLKVVYPSTTGLHLTGEGATRTSNENSNEFTKSDSDSPGP